jgi:high potential iron-sulfur protein
LAHVLKSIMLKHAAARRRILKQALGWAGSSLVLLGTGARRAAAQKSSKTALLYQDHPHDGRRCGECKYFAAAPDANAGSCTVVDGPVDRNGWCLAFSPRQ